MFCPRLVILVLFGTVVGLPIVAAGVVTTPQWNTPQQGDSFSVDVNIATTCRNVTPLNVLAFGIYNFSVSPNEEFVVSQADIEHYFLGCNVSKLLKASYTVTLRAFLISNSDDYSEIDITVNVSNVVTNSAPVFHNLPTTNRLLRNKYSLDGEYVLMDVNVADADGDSITITLSETTEFAVSVTQIRVAATLENLTSPFELVVTATDNGTPVESSTSTLTLSLGYAPQFTDPVDSNDIIYVCETLVGADEVMTLSATDQDTDDSTLVFSMDNSPEITKSKFVINGTVLQVADGVSFNYEEYEAVLEYSISLEVSDGTFSSTLNTKLVLEDYNDNAPTFESIVSSVYTGENTAAGTSVFRITATDADKTDPNNNLTYSLTGSSDWSIDSKTGEIIVSTGVTLNFTKQSIYVLTVEATDGGDPQESATATVSIHLLTAPKFDNLATATTVDVDENVTVGTFVFELTVSDQDNTTIPTVSIMSQSVPSVFKLEGKTVRTNAPLDKETLDSYSITFNATDGTSVTESAVLTINVNDVNDVPVITSVLPSNNVSLSELTVAETSVFNVSASDQDTTSPNNMLTFSLTGSTDFNINSTSGKVSVATGVTLSYTVMATYDLLVKVTDGGTPLKSATTALFVVIETEPVFDNLASPVSVDLNENADLNTAVFTLTVSDGDGKGPLLTTLLTPSDDFILNGNILKPNQTIDAEKQQTHVLRFKVSDGTYEMQSADLTITVNDLNDMPPVIVKPIYDITIPETASVGYSIVTITAGDADSTSPNNLLTYSIQSGNDKQYFAINSGNGSVTLAKAPNVIGQGTYPLEVIVVDGGTPALNDTVQFNIVINATTVDECASNPCQNAATCSSFINVYYCSCATGWTGIRCESNIDDCKPDSCLNNGTCIDGVNSVTCNCSAGWSGDKCTDACTDNKWDRNCAENCNCPNASRLMANVGNQQCDIKSGACKCNEQWTGTKCDKDFDECQNPTICAENANNVCENTVGGYNCVCAVGYSGPFDSCTKQIEELPVLKAGENLVLVNTSLQSDCPPDLDKPSVYNPIKEKLRIMMNEQTKRNCIITKVWCGSLEFEAVIVVNDTADVAVRLQEIRDGKTLTYGNQTVTASNITINNNPLKPTNSQSGDFAEKVCEVYTFISPCAADHQCVSESGRPTCKYIEPDNLALILGLGLGLLLPLLLVLIIVILVWYCNRNRRSTKSRSRRSSSRSVESRPWQGRSLDNSWQGKLPRQEIKDYNFVYDNYALPTKRDYYETSYL